MSGKSFRVGANGINNSFLRLDGNYTVVRITADDYAKSRYGLDVAPPLRCYSSYNLVRAISLLE